MRSGIEVADPGMQRGCNGRRSVAVGDLSVEVADRSAAEAERGDCDVGPADGAFRDYGISSRYQEAALAPKTAARSSALNSAVNTSVISTICS